jgi:enterochelin esterase-like enzyme
MVDGSVEKGRHFLIATPVAGARNGMNQHVSPARKPSNEGKSASWPTRFLLLGVAVALLVVGLLVGEPVAPRDDLPQRGVSPIVRRTVSEALAVPAAMAPYLNEPTANGRVVEERFWSAALNREVIYAAYLPPGYDDGDARYPVLYALHGIGGSHVEWIEFGAPAVADSLFTTEGAPPFIMVFPQGDQSYWFNHPNGDAWADYLVEDVIPYIDSRYRTVTAREGRAIGGISMGATGALQIALRRPDLFSVVGVHSPSLPAPHDVDFHLRDPKVFWYFADREAYAPYDPFQIAQWSPDRDGLRIWLDVGDADQWRETVELLAGVLAGEQLNHRFSIGENGSHEHIYWIPRMPDYLNFYAFELLSPNPFSPYGQEP